MAGNSRTTVNLVLVAVSCTVAVTDMQQVIVDPYSYDSNVKWKAVLIMC